MSKGKSLPKVLKLDYDVWRCGWVTQEHAKKEGLEDNVVGDGDTMLLNDKGKMCCLGQFCEQSGIDREFLLHRTDPRETGDTQDLIFVEELAEKSFYEESELINSKLTVQAVSINDNFDTSVSRKAYELKKLFKEHGYSIELVNFPDHVVKKVEELESTE